MFNTLVEMKSNIEKLQESGLRDVNTSIKATVISSRPMLYVSTQNFSLDLLISRIVYVTETVSVEMHTIYEQ